MFFKYLVIFSLSFLKAEIVNLPEPHFYKVESGLVKILAHEGIFAEEPGYPALPSYVKTYILDGALNKVDFEVLEAETLRLNNTIEPQPEPAILSLPLKHKDICPMNSSVYGVDNFYPKTPVKVIRVKSDKNTSLLELKIYSLQYNPIKNLVIIIKKIMVNIDYTPVKSEKNISRKLVENLAFDVGSTTPLYIIVTPDSFKSYFEPLRKWREQCGMRAKIVSLEYIESNYPGRDAAERLRNYIKANYEDTLLIFVVLGGDEGIVPSRIAFAMDCEAGFHPEENDIRADLYFSDMDGDWDRDGDGIFGELEDSIDMYPDVFVGRIPVHNGQDVQNFVNKILNYEKEPTLDYIDHYLFLGMVLWQDPFTDAGIHKDRIDSLYIPHYISVEKLYETLGNETHSNVMAALNHGRHIINHDGHGWYSGMWLNNSDPVQSYLSRTDMDNLSNGSRYSILYSIGCWVGAFDFDCIAEHFINSRSGGGVAIIANSRYGWGSPGNPGFGYSDKLDDQFFKHMFEDKNKEIGIVLSKSKADFVPYAQDLNVFRWVEYEINLMGDPAMPIWTAIPDTFEITAPPYYTDSAGFKIEVTSNLIPVKDAICTLWMDSLYSKSVADLNGNAYFKLSGDLPDSLILTVRYYNIKPKQIVLYRKSEDILEIDSIWIRDIASGDEYISPGDSAVVFFKIANKLDSIIVDTLLIHSTADTMVNILDTIVPVVFDPGGTRICSSKVYISEFFPMNHSFMLTVKSHYLNKTEMINVVSPQVELHSTFKKPFGELGVVFTNLGLMPTGNVGISVSSLSPGILTINAFDSLISNIEPYEIETVTVSYSCSDSSQLSYLNITLTYEDSITKNFILSLFGVDSVFRENFEGGLLKWVNTGDWSVSTIRRFEGAYSLHCASDSFYTDNSHDTITSQEFTVGNFPVLEFWVYYEYPTYGTDGLYVEVKDGQIWRTIDFIGSGGALDSIYNIGSRWVKVQYPLNFLDAGEKTGIRLIFESDNDNQVGEGVYIDNIIVYNAYPAANVYDKAFNFRDRFVSLSPVITSGTLFIDAISSNNKWITIRVLDISGRIKSRKRIYLTKGLNRRSIFIGDLNKGIYFIEVLDKIRKVVLIK